MFKAKLGNIGKTRIVEITDENVVVVSKKNGTVVQQIRAEDIAGIAYSKPGLAAGVLRFCENYDDSLEETTMAIMDAKDSILVEKKDLPHVEKIMEWFEENKGENVGTSPYDLEIRTKTSTLALDGKTVIIRHSAGPLLGEGGTFKIPVKAINGVRLKKPAGALVDGNIIFDSGGGAGDTKTVEFKEKDLSLFENFRDRVESMMNEGEVQAAPVSEADELKRFAALHAEGLLTDEEFQAKKKQILGL